jgi:hypothetical protein
MKGGDGVSAEEKSLLDLIETLAVITVSAAGTAEIAARCVERIMKARRTRRRNRNPKRRR